jgi:hypothetical protein
MAIHAIRIWLNHLPRQADPFTIGELRRVIHGRK